AQVTGVPAKFRRHERHHLTQPKRAERTNAADVSDGGGYQEPRSQEISSEEDHILSAREIVNGLRRCRYDGKTRIPIACLAVAGGLSRQTLYVAMNTGVVSKPTCAALTPILREIAAGRLGFRRRARKWEEVEHLPSAGHEMT